MAAGFGTMNNESPHIIIGEESGWGDPQPFGIAAVDERQHLYIIGKTGSGKTTLLRNLILQHIRPGTVIGDNCRIGNYVEIKKSTIGNNTFVSHLSYIGDAKIGSGVNIGAGTITCNYDGFKKSKTIIGDNVFVGSDTKFVAPVKVGSGAVIAAGSVITENVPAQALAVARARQINKEKWVTKRSKKK